MPRNPEDIPITSASLRVRGDIYSTASDSPDVRIIDGTSQQSIYGTSADAGGTAVDPVTGSSLVAGTSLGFGGVVADYVATGLYNASFFLPPQNATDPIDVDNPLPYWTTGGTSAASLTWKRTTSGSATCLQLSGGGFTTGDDVYLEQWVPVRGFIGNDALWARSIVNGGANAATDATIVCYVNLSFFNASGVQTGTTREATFDTAALVASGADTDILVAWDGSNAASRFIPSDAAFVRVRFGVRAGATVANAVLLTFYTVRLFRSQDVLVLSAPARNTNAVAGVRFNSNRNAIEGIAHNNLTNAMYSFAPSIVALPFTFNNLAATATNNMQPWDNAVAQGSPYIDMPYRGTVIGLSYRISGARTGGTFNVRARTGGGTYLLSTGAIGTGGALTSSTTQAINTAAGQFTASTALGVDVVTSTLAPTTLNISVVMYVAIDWTT